MKYLQLSSFFASFALSILLLSYSGQLKAQTEAYYPNIGEIHNQALDKIITTTDISPDKSFAENIEILKQFFLDEYEVDISGFVNEFATGSGDNMKWEFEPFDVLATHGADLSPYFYNKLENLLIQTQAAGETDKVAVLQIIDDLKAEVMDDPNYTTEESNQFLNMLTVYRSSVNYWYPPQSGGGHGTGFILKPWHVAAADLLGGLFGGIAGSIPTGGLGGPLGAGLGYVAASAQSFIREF